MRDVFILTTAGVLVGAALGLWLPAPHEDGWLWSAVGGAIAYGSFALCGHWLSRLRGRPLGWAVGAPFGLTVGCAVWMALLVPVSDNRLLAMIGAFTGFVAGIICGPLLGAFALYRNIKSGRCTEKAEIIGTTLMLLGTVIFGGGLATLIVVHLVNSRPRL
jgi:hypothetical protein